ncbi:MAG: fluoride efflux transporter CrcB [Phycisphaerales bacterium]|nr:fluoride efflux transporter CrcB [Phycisphaerales bacterium]
MKLLMIFLGAGAGGAGRYLLGGWVQGWAGPGFPLGTLVVNISGCLAIGFLAALFDGPALIREEWRLAILIGVLGGYTTFSSFGNETINLLREGEWARAGLNVVLSNGLGLAAVWGGAALAGLLPGRGMPS